MRASQKKSLSARGSKNPPQFKPTIVTRHKARYVCNNAGGVSARSVSNTELMDHLCLATAAAVAYRLLQGIKVKKIEIWACNSAGNATNTIVCEFLRSAGVGGPGWSFSDSAMGVSDIAHIVCTPPRGSLLEDWVPTAPNNTTLMELTLPQGSIVDITFDISIVDTDAPELVGAAVAAATVGKVYMRALDNSNGAPVIIPVGYDSI
jgi:hypothetical protein